MSSIRPLVETIREMALEHEVCASYRHLGMITKEAANLIGLPFATSAERAMRELLGNGKGRSVLIHQILQYGEDPDDYIQALSSRHNQDRFDRRFSEHMVAKNEAKNGTGVGI